MTQEEKNITLKAMDLLYEYLTDKVGSENGEMMKEILFDEFFEYNNGNRESLFKQIEKRW